MSVVAAVVVVIGSAVAGVSAPALTPCTLAHPAGPRAYAQCGSVAVAIDPNDAEKTLSIGYAVLPPTGAEPKGAPIALLAGGPGQAATRDFVALLPTLRELRGDHALVLIDIRGTGRSQPQSCKDDRPLQERLRTEQDVDAAAVCAKAMTLDPRFITTRDAARDVDAVRAALGVEHWNVLGISYGTRLAVVYDQLFPGRARTLILDGVAPLDRALGEDIALDMTHALQSVGDDAVSHFVALKAKLKASPVTVSVRHPTSGKLLEVPVTDSTINGTVRMLLYADETRALLGPLLAQATGGDDLTPLVALAITVGEQLEGAIHGAVNASILCAEDAPYFTDTPPPKEAVFDDERPYIKALCAKWPHATVPQPTMKPTSTPTLLLSGALDPVTPPHHARRIEKQFADHAHVVLKGMGHNVLPRGCIVSVVDDFVRHGTAKDLDVDCAAKIGPFPAFIDLMGPAP